MIHTQKDFEENAFLAVETVAALLKRGRLNLFLGAGVSRGFGLPGWVSLTARILGRASDPVFIKELHAKSDKDLGKLMDDIDTGDADYVRKVHQALYCDVPGNLVDHLVRSPLLLAVVALLTGTNRGRIHEVFTYNYDDLIEQYLTTLGYAVCIRTGPSDFSSRADVEINHVHGFIPQAWTVKCPLPELVLSERSFRNRRSEIDKGWSSFVEHSLYSKDALLIGLSGDDESVISIFNRAKPNVTRSTDYNGYWLLAPDAYERNRGSILDIDMCPIPIEREKLPEFVFRVCQTAARP